MPCSRKDSVPEPACPEDSLVSVMHGWQAARSSTTISIGGTMFPFLPLPLLCGRMCPTQGGGNKAKKDRGLWEGFSCLDRGWGRKGAAGQ